MHQLADWMDAFTANPDGAWAQVEAPADQPFTQNRQRQDAVPESVIYTLLRKWQFAEPPEAHQVPHVT